MNRSNFSHPIFLSGMMGAGKSTIGKRLAHRIGLPFFDLDQLIIDREQRSISEIFSSEGEDYFRELEASILVETSKTTKGILALGGGSLQNQHLVDHIKLYGWLIFLDVPVQILHKRLKNSTHRPLVKQAGKEGLQEKLDQMLQERLPFYKQAHITIKTQNRSKRDITDEIIKKVTLYENRN